MSKLAKVSFGIKFHWIFGWLSKLENLILFSSLIVERRFLSSRIGAGFFQLGNGDLCFAQEEFPCLSLSLYWQYTEYRKVSVLFVSLLGRKCQAVLVPDSPSYWELLRRVLLICVFWERFRMLNFRKGIHFRLGLPSFSGDWSPSL